LEPPSAAIFNNETDQRWSKIGRMGGIGVLRMIRVILEWCGELDGDKNVLSIMNESGGGLGLAKNV
jgi:hypothetical protein